MDRRVRTAKMPATQITTEQIKGILDKAYGWSRTQHYRGYNKHDGLNSPLLRTVFGWGKWPRIIAIQTVMRSPVNIRPYLLVPKTYNPKGLALFTQGLLALHQASGDDSYLDEAHGLLKLLQTIKSPGNWAGDCWGYCYPWQDPGFYAKTNTPNAVVTAFVCEAFLSAYHQTQNADYLATVGSAVQFFLNDLTLLKSDDQQLCLGYMPLPMTMRVMDVSILIGSVISQYNSLSGDRHAKGFERQETAKRLVNYVVKQQTDYGAWFYTDPPSDSRIKHDNYHTGFILDALSRYMRASNDYSWLENYNSGLRFYAEKLFNQDGSPRWMSDKDFPHDIHGAAQGILTFSRHCDSFPGMAHNIARWAISTMYNDEGRFYYQQTRRRVKRFTLLRWCNAWMCRALAALLNSK